MAQPPLDASSVTVEDSDELSRVVVAGELDADAADALERSCDALLGHRRRLELDLSCLTASTPAGVAALSRCLLLGRRLPDGVGITVANDVGRRALLASMAEI